MIEGLYNIGDRQIVEVTLWMQNLIQIDGRHQTWSNWNGKIENKEDIWKKLEALKNGLVEKMSTTPPVSHQYSQKLFGRPAVCSMAIALSIMVQLNCSAVPFCCGEPSIIRWCSIPLWLRMFLTLAAIYLPPLLKCSACSLSLVWVLAQNRNFCNAATN